MWLLVMLVVAAVSLGANCEPSPAPSPECKECPAGQVRGCFDKCVTPLDEGAECSRDPCAPNGRCKGDLSCIGDGRGKDRCIDVGLVLGARCTPGFNDPCPNRMYCKPAHCVSPDFGTSICALPVETLGAACDGDMLKPQMTNACAPCGAGLACVNGRCRAECSVDADCPCGRGLSCTTGKTVHPPNPRGVCVTCKNFRDACDGDSPCCDGTACLGGRCCRPTGDNCAAKADCCGTDVCITGKCRECGKRDIGACHSNDECCPGLECASGTCRKRCVAPSGICDVPGQTGECRNGSWACPTAFGDPVCKQIHTPSPEVCDGKDNDCNGATDDIKEEGCMSTPSIAEGAAVGCPSWFKSPGTWKCGGAPDFKRYCDTGGNFCYKCGDTLPSGGYCGRCPDDVCTGKVSGNECAPRHTCLEGTPCIRRADCSGTTSLPKCWSPDWRGECIKD